MGALRQPWIRGTAFDTVLILGPALVAVAVVLLWGDLLAASDVSPWAWLILIVGIDVAHVYSTLYRTYFDRKMREERGLLLILVPVFAWAVGAMLFSLGPWVFWRAMAYLAVFHFVRQQYGFLRIYTRQEPSTERRDVWRRRFEALTIYVATGFPLLYWHASSPRKFHWFVDGDFFTGDWPAVRAGGFVIYLLVLASYFVNELRLSLARRVVNVPKNLLVIGTAASWYVGIVAFDGDAAFTLTNVISHGVPYTALIWATKQREGGAFFRPALAPLFLGALFVLAYLEEWLWDGLIWRDHPTLFAWIFPKVDTSWLLIGLVPLLVVPQVTHYVIDGFIWRRPSPAKAGANCRLGTAS